VGGHGRCAHKEFIVKWFGVASVETDGDLIATPVGEPCAYCEEPIEAGDRGVTIPHIGGPEPVEKPYHFECHLRTVIGSVAHQMGQCSCHGGTEHDPPGLTRRQAARAAYRVWQETQWRRDGTNN
jgi:hypothetical protein